MDARAPHSYTLKRTWPGEDEFVEALRKMRAMGRIEEFFRGYWYRRFNANGYKYWTMGASLDGNPPSRERRARFRFREHPPPRIARPLR